MPTTSNKPQAKRPRTAKELRAIRRKVREREKRDHEALGIRPIWSLPTGQPVRRNYILSQVLCPFASAALGLREQSWGVPPVLAVIIAVVFWLCAATFIAWSARKAFPY